MSKLIGARVKLLTQKELEGADFVKLTAEQKKGARVGWPVSEYVGVVELPRHLTRELTPHEVRHGIVAMFLDPDYDHDRYMREAVHALIAQLRGFTYNLKKGTLAEDWDKHPMDRMTEDGLPLELVMVLRTAVGTLEWLTNCTSYSLEKGFQSYDIFELSNRFRLLAQMLDRMYEQSQYRDTQKGEKGE